MCAERVVNLLTKRVIGVKAGHLTPERPSVKGYRILAALKTFMWGRPERFPGGENGYLWLYGYIQLTNYTALQDCRNQHEDRRFSRNGSLSVSSLHDHPPRATSM